MPFVKFVLPTASKHSITHMDGYVLNAWYHSGILSQGDLDEYGGTMESAEYIRSLIEHEISENKIPAKRVLLGGFSQSVYICFVSPKSCIFNLKRTFVLFLVNCKGAEQCR